MADPEKHWKPHRSALELAVCWESARETERGIPPEVARVFDTFEHTQGAELLIGVPEHRVPFEGGGHDSQSDLWGLLKVKGEQISMTIEAKAGEKLDLIVKEWLSSNKEKSRKPERLKDLCKWLAVKQSDIETIRYQLLHRAASALKEAKRFGAAKALFLIQSFSRESDSESLDDFKKFGKVMHGDVSENKIARCEHPTDVPLMLGWITSEAAVYGKLLNAV